jgi:hypothetical protein
LGIALIFLWDLPCTFWGWKEHDNDLNFKEMIEHLSSDSYRTYIKNININYKDEEILHIIDARRLYRELSNITHGKISSFESNLPERFTYSLCDWGHVNDFSHIWFGAQKAAAS